METKYSFFKDLITKSSEHSKKLTLIDTIIYVILMVIILALLMLRVELCLYLKDIVGYITTAYVALRATYGTKAAIENYQKLKNGIENNDFSENDG